MFNYREEIGLEERGKPSGVVWSAIWGRRSVVVVFADLKLPESGISRIRLSVSSLDFISYMAKSTTQVKP